MGGVELAPPADGLRWGRRVSAAAVRAGRAAAPDRRHRGADAAAHDHLARDPPDRARALRLDRRRVRPAGTARSMTWDAWAASEARAIRAAGRWRAPRDLDASGTEGVAEREPTAGAVVSFASNDYLGLTSHPAVIAAAHDALDRWGTGAGSARLIVGSRPIHGELERELAEWKATPSAARSSPPASPRTSACSRRSARAGVLVCSDELNHASIIDGCRLARADAAVYRHRDLDHLRALLRDRGGRRALVVSDTVFSMDGDVGRRRRADRAVRARSTRCSCSTKRTRCSGPTSHVERRRRRAARRHLLEDARRARRIRRRARPRYVELIENSARPYIFTTAPTPADTAAALAALRIVRSPEGDALVARLRAQRRPAAARPPVADPAVRVRRGAARRRRGRRAARTRARRARDPAADRRARHLAAAGRDERRAHRRARSIDCSRRSADVFGDVADPHDERSP